MTRYLKQISTPLRASPITTTLELGVTTLSLNDVNGPDGERIFKAIKNEPRSPETSKKSTSVQKTVSTGDE